jgi:UPF0271 protein
MEVNINSDLGESSKLHSTENDPALLKIVNSSNIACGYHAGDEETMRKTISISKENGVSIGAHPSYLDKENFGRKRMNISADEVTKLVIDQCEILSKVADKLGMKVTHVKPHGALSNMACENYELSFTIAKAIKQFDPNMIFLAHAQTEMEKAVRDLKLRIACEVFADRNYEDNGYLVARSKPNAMILGKEESVKHVLRMLENQALNCYSGKKIPCDIDSICVHGDEKTAVDNAKYLREVLIKNGFQLKSLDKLKKIN